MCSSCCTLGLIGVLVWFYFGQLIFHALFLQVMLFFLTGLLYNVISVRLLRQLFFGLFVFFFP